MKLDHCDSCVAELKHRLTLKWCLSTSKALLFFFVFPPFFLWVSQWLALSPPRKKVPDLKLVDGCGRSVCLHVRASGVPNLAVGMNVRAFVVVCVSLLTLWWTGKLSMVYHTSHPSTAWKSPRPPYT